MIMKRSKILRVLTLSALLGGFSGSALAEDVFEFDGQITIPTASDGNRSVDGDLSSRPDLTVASKRVNCEEKTKKFVSLKFLKTLMLGQDMSFTNISSSKSIRMTIPSYVTGGSEDGDSATKDTQQCFALKTTASQTDNVKVKNDENVKYLYLAYQNNIDLTWDKFKKVAGMDSETEWKGISKQVWERMSEESKVTACLMAKGVIQKKGGGYEYKVPVKPLNKERLYSTTFRPDVQEEEELTKILLASATPDSDKVYSRLVKGGLNVTTPGTGDKCLYLEKMDQEDGDLVVYENSMLRDALNTCASGDVRAIDQMLKDLRLNVESSEAYKLSIQLLAQTRAEALDATAASIYDRLKEKGKEIKDAYKGGKWRIEEDEARELMAEYAGLLKELNRQVYDVYTDELKILLEQRKKLRGDHRDAVDKRIKEINEKVGELSEMKNKLYKRTVEKMAEHFALTDHALDVEGFFLKSEYMARVRPTGRNFDDRKSRRRGKSLSISDANDKIEKAVEKYERKMERWELNRDAKDGDTYPSRLAYKDMQTIRRRQQMDQKRYQQREQKYQRYCQSTFGGFQMNPVACRKYMSASARGRRQQRYQRRNAQHQAAYANAAQTYQQRRGWAEEARRRLADDEGYDDYSYYYDDYDDYSYDDDFGYDDGFTMGGQNYSMMNGQMGNPYSGPARRNTGFQQYGQQQNGIQALPYSTNYLGAQGFQQRY